MKISVLSTSLLVLALGAGGAARATDYYVSPTGSDSAAGTMAAPWATLQKGATTAVAGDTVWIRGGTYAITTPATSGGGINFTKSGTASANINYFAYQGEHPKFDFTNLVISTTGYTMGFTVSGSYLHFKGLEICCVPMNTFSNNGISVTGSAAGDTFEQLDMHGNSGNGIFIGNKSGGGHLVLNCDAHDNYDATSNQGQGQNADGFGVHYQTSGATTIVRGCRAWWNSDDGYDLINQEIPVTVENSWAMMNGYAMYGTYSPTSGNGNGFKMGSSKTGVRHLVQNNVAWKNKASGFYANHSTGGNNWYNNTSFMNGTNYNMLASSFDSSGNVVMTITLTGALAHIMRNNIGYPNKQPEHGRRRHHVQHLGSEHHAGQQRLREHFGSQRLDDGDADRGDGRARAASGRRQPAERRLHAPLGGEPDDRQGDRRRASVRRRGARSRRLRVRRDRPAARSGTTGTGGSAGAGGTTTTGTGGAGTGGTTATGSGGNGAAGKVGSSGSGGGTGTGGATTTTGTGGAGTVATGGVSGGSGGTPGGSGGVSGGSGGSPGSGGDSSGSGGTPDGSGGANATGSGGTGSGESASSGCSCAVDASAGHAPLLGVLGALALVLRRSRRRRSA